MQKLIIHKANGKLSFNNHEVNFIIPSSLNAKSTGLLNHISLKENEGIAYINKKMFHTFTMGFPICVAGFNKEGDLFTEPQIILPDSVFKMPSHTYLTLECHSSNQEFFNKLSPGGLLKINIYPKKIAKLLFLMPRIIFIFFIIFLLNIFCSSIFADNNLKLEVGESKRINLLKPPESIEITDPDIIDLQRVGFTNDINITGKQKGFSKIIVKYLNNEKIYRVQINPIFHEQSFNFRKNTKYISHSSIQNLEKLNGISITFENGKIVIHGEIKSIEIFREIVKIICHKSNEFTPA
ncbi:MAG: pilus assembly protein N-terminal domain-containing protein, partial [Silvanigrellaceae bacterium]|nr:pilus assembly protein N-terminal domain-containing protein [Silvanigrellaceae bacterium]